MYVSTYWQLCFFRKYLSFCIFLFEVLQLKINIKYTSFRYCYSSFLSRTFSSFTVSSYFFSFTVSISTGAPKFFFRKSIEFSGFYCSSYSPTRALVRLSMTPVFSRYLRNYYFLDSVVYEIMKWNLLDSSLFKINYNFSGILFYW